MNVLVVGAGGREHALAWQLAQSESVTRVFVAPGNAGTVCERKCLNVDIAVSDFSGLRAFAQRYAVQLTIVGPEEPMVNGIREVFDEAELKCLAPSSEAAQIEGSKSFAKAFMERHDIPTAAFHVSTTIADAKAYLADCDLPTVLKADGLAAGKGVVVAHDKTEAVRVAEDMLSGDRFGEAGRKIVFEQFLEGEEASYIVLSDGSNFVPFASSQDHKPIFDGNEGPNTGGMGAYSPAPVVDDEVEQKIQEQVILPTLGGLSREGRPFQGFLYAGLMISPDKDVHVVEFNCRFGDPEAQSVLFRLESDLAEYCLAALTGELGGRELEFANGAAVGVVLASGGYPNSYKTGIPITGLDDISSDIKVFHAGTDLENGQLVTKGGRVLCVVGSDPDLQAARTKTYEAIDQIHWVGQHFRTDIGAEATKHLSNTTV